MSASNDRLYCVDQTGRLLIVDANTGAKLGVLASVMPTLLIANPKTDRVFVGTRGGVIQCLHEVGNVFPVIHLDAAEAAAPEDETQATPESGTPTEVMPESTDPFGAPTAPPAEPDDLDPFGAGSDPFGGTSDPGDDPFSADDPFSP